MKAIKNGISSREKILIAILVLVLLGGAYFLFVDQPVRNRTDAALAEEARLEAELVSINEQIADMRKMEEMMAKLGTTETDYMASYNNRKAEIHLLNDILKAANSYSISFGEVTRDGDQIRRDVNMQFTTGSYSAMEGILSRLANGPYRCLLKDVNCTSAKGDVKNGDIAVSVSMTFYETMVGSNDNAGLPQEKTDETNGTSGSTGWEDFRE